MSRHGQGDADEQGEPDQTQISMFARPFCGPPKEFIDETHPLADRREDEIEYEKCDRDHKEI